MKNVRDATFLWGEGLPHFYGYVYPGIVVDHYIGLYPTGLDQSPLDDPQIFLGGGWGHPTRYLRPRYCWLYALLYLAFSTTQCENHHEQDFFITIVGYTSDHHDQLQLIVNINPSTLVQP